MEALQRCAGLSRQVSTILVTCFARSSINSRTLKCPVYSLLKCPEVPHRTAFTRAPHQANSKGVRHVFTELVWPAIVPHPHGLCRNVLSPSPVRSLSSEALGRRRVVPNEDAKQYLESLGLDSNRLLKLRPTVLRQSVSTLRQHVDLLRGLGLEDSDIVSIIYKEASFLRKDVKSVHELVEYLRTTGLPDSKIANIFQRAPRFFTTPDTVMDNIEYMKYLGVTDKNVCYTLVYTPSLFYRIQGGIERVASYLKQVMTEEKFSGDHHLVIRYIMRNDPTLFNRQVSELETNIKFLREFGLTGDDLISVFRYCPSSVRIGTEFLRARLDLLKNRLSLTQEGVRGLVRRHPPLLHASVETIESHIDVALELGFTTQEILKTPRYFARNLEMVKERYKELKAVGCQPTLGSFIHSKEKHELIVLKFKMMKKRKDRSEKHHETPGTGH